MTDRYEDQSVEAEFLGSLTICEDGQLLPTYDIHGGVLDKFGIYRPTEDPPEPFSDRRAER